MTEEVKQPWVTRWGSDPDTWNIDDPEDDEDSDGSYMPGRELVREAVARWALTQPAAAPVTAETVAAVFNLPIELAVEAIGGEPCALGQAVQVWTSLQSNDATDRAVGEVATAFLLPPSAIVEAVEKHPWMYLSGDLSDMAGMLIGHDGE